MDRDAEHRAAEYLGKADWCATQAAKATDPGLQSNYLKMETEWRALARRVVQGEKRQPPAGKSP